MADTYTTTDGDTLDAIAFRHYGRHGGTTELLLEANRGLAAHPLLLPPNIKIVLPILDAAEPVQTVKLYD